MDVMEKVDQESEPAMLEEQEAADSPPEEPLPPAPAGKVQKAEKVKRKKRVIDNFWAAFGVTLGFLALFVLALFIPIAGILFVFVLSPYLAGFLGGKYTSDKVRMGAFCGLVWGLIMAYIIPSMLTGPLDADIRLGVSEIIAIIILIASNTLFCALGARNRGIRLAD